MALLKPVETTLTPDQTKGYLEAFNELLEKQGDTAGTLGYRVKNQLVSIIKEINHGLVMGDSTIPETPVTDRVGREFKTLVEQAERTFGSQAYHPMIKLLTGKKFLFSSGYQKLAPEVAENMLICVYNVLAGIDGPITQDKLKEAGINFPVQELSYNYTDPNPVQPAALPASRPPRAEGRPKLTVLQGGLSGKISSSAALSTSLEL
jgi:hypothetical protein